MPEKKSGPVLPSGPGGAHGPMAEHPDILLCRLRVPEGRCEYVSEGVHALTGYTREAFCAGPLLREIVQPGSRAEYDAAWARLCAGASVPPLEFAIRHRSGVTRWLRQRSALVRDAEGHPLAVECFLTDVTRSRQTQDHLMALARQRTAELEASNQRLAALVAELGDSSARLRLVIDHMPAAISYVDAEQRYRLNNRVYEEWFGHTPEALAGRTLREVLGEAAYTELAPHIQAALAGREVEYEAVVPYQHGGARHVRATYVPHRGEDGGVQGFFVLVHDITEARAAEQAERRHLMELAHAGRLSALGEMAGQITHEMVQPLTAIAHYASSLTRFLEQGRTEQARAVAEQLGAKARRALDLVAHLRRFSARHEAEEMRPVDLRELTAAALEVVDYEQGEGEVRVEAAEGLPPVRGDAVLIEQVLVNLIRNALEASGGKGKARVRVRLQAHEGLVEVAVRDNGPGLPEAVREKLFQPFFTTKADGVGLGLAICRRIVESHGGRLQAHNDAAGGAVFAFTLPFAAAG